MYKITSLISNKIFQKSISSIKNITLIYFWAEWCAPCKAAYPMMKNIAKIHVQEVVVYKIDIDNNSVLAKKYGIKSIPTVLLFHKSRIIQKSTNFILEGNAFQLCNNII